MLTNTVTAIACNARENPALSIAIDAAERRHRSALCDIARLARTGQISLDEAADLEAETLARFSGEVRELELCGEDPFARLL